MNPASTIVLLALILPCILLSGPERDNIGDEMPLEKAVEDFNNSFPDANPLTVSEVVAAIRNIKSEHPDIPDAVYKIYQSVVDQRVLPRGMSFSKTTRLTDDDYEYRVKWMDLSLVPVPRDTPDPVYGWGFNFRIRARFVSSDLLSAEDKAAQVSMRKQIRERVEHDGGLKGLQP